MEESGVDSTGLSFHEWLDRWVESLPRPHLTEAIAEPNQAAILSVDMINGFCCEGPLASPRVAGIIPALVRLFESMNRIGVRHFILSQDTHDPEAPEFGAYPPHAVAGTSESETISELKSLPFADTFTIIEKNSINSFIGTDLPAWLVRHPEVSTFVLVGNCTDLCVYQAAMHMRLRANAFGLPYIRVIVPADCVQTYDMPVDVAHQVGAMPHDGDLLHRIFLYHMALNGVEVLSGLS
ncbi:MAG: cysteine hydrolase [Chloroflexi bacterium]|nr:cysteine hydrolase [Chloroflexota bacterium]